MIKYIAGSVVDLNHSDIFTMMNEYSYAAFYGVLSNIFMKAHVSSQFRKGAYDAAIIVNDAMTQPYNNQPESSVKRIVSIINRMPQPNKKINIGIFLATDMCLFKEHTKIGLKHTVSQCWNITNSNKHKNIITLNTPPKQLDSSHNKVRYFVYNDIKDSLNNMVSVSIDYNMPIDETFNLLEKSKVHICYQGGTAWLSIAMNIPTIIIHPLNNPTEHELHLKFKLFGQELGNINILDKNRKITHVRNHPCEHHIYISDLENVLEKILK